MHSTWYLAGYPLDWTKFVSPFHGRLLPNLEVRTVPNVAPFAGSPLWRPGFVTLRRWSGAGLPNEHWQGAGHQFSHMCATTLQNGLCNNLQEIGECLQDPSKHQACLQWLSFCLFSTLWLPHWTRLSLKVPAYPGMQSVHIAVSTNAQGNFLQNRRSCCNLDIFWCQLTDIDGNPRELEPGVGCQAIDGFSFGQTIICKCVQLSFSLQVHFGRLLRRSH